MLGDPDDAITTLSGGNQQKVVIARWLAAGPRVLLLNDPTRGIDVGAKRDLYALLARLAAEGLAVVMLSTEVDEHVELMDRVLVFREHELLQRDPARETLARRRSSRRSSVRAQDDAGDGMSRGACRRSTSVMRRAGARRRRVGCCGCSTGTASRSRCS